MNEIQPATQNHSDGRIRCSWVTGDALYQTYHDSEWGRPIADSRRLFEMLCLEGMQAGLSWLTILKRRDAFREAFDGFNPERVAAYSIEKVEELMQNRGIIRNKRKIEAVIGNARSLLKLSEKQDFSDFIWSFSGGIPRANHYSATDQLPVSSAQSRKMSRELKKCGFTFVGETICYAFMEAVGMVNDHLTECFCYEAVCREQKAFRLKSGHGE